MRIIADVPRGAFLLGWYRHLQHESLPPRCNRRTIRRFSIASTKAASTNCLGRMVAKKYQPYHHEIVVRTVIPSHHSESLRNTSDEPSRSSAIPTFIIIEFAAPLCKVALLPGDAGERTLLGGYGSLPEQVHRLARFESVPPCRAPGGVVALWPSAVSPYGRIICTREHARLRSGAATPTKTDVSRSTRARTHMRSRLLHPDWMRPADSAPPPLRPH